MRHNLSNKHAHVIHDEVVVLFLLCLFCIHSLLRVSLFLSLLINMTLIYTDVKNTNNILLARTEGEKTSKRESILDYTRLCFEYY